ncbi:MAG: PAS-domain containing protein [Paracoccaceae bacterium]
MTDDFGRMGMEMDWVMGVGIVLTSLLAAVGGLLLITALPQRNAHSTASVFLDNPPGVAFLFDGEVMVDATPGARALLSTSHNRGAPWVKLMAFLAPHFPDLEARMMRLPHEGSLMLASVATTGEPLMLQAEHRGGLSRLKLIDSSPGERTNAHDPMVQRAFQEELDLLRHAVAKTTALIWRERDDGEVIWANAAYLLRAAERVPPGQELTWPLPRLFDRTAAVQGAAGQRQRLGLPNGGATWFDLISFPENGGHLLFAQPADAAVQAETALRDFMQTLTKTFAHLPIGLAIFDQSRQLQLFNPALLDLTGLPVDFLSMRPSLLSVLDALRDRAMIPEPKDYRGWRRQLIEMEKAAASGTYEETWSLPGGQTYRVIGRPHANGAIALMIEDISTEMLRTRRYRADLELGQSVIDELEAALAVFSDAGQMVMSNAAYAALWSHDPAAALGEGSVRSLCAHWRTQSAPSPVWAEFEDFVTNPGDRKAWSAEVRLLDGRLLACRFSRLAGGATLVSFHPVLAAEMAPRVAPNLKSA